MTRVFPPVCTVCNTAGVDGMDLCTACRAALQENAPACRCCAQPLHSGDDGGGRLCGRCQREPPRFDRVVAPYIYGEPLDQIIGQLKFSQKLRHAPLLAGLFLSQADIGEMPDCLMPVPLHPGRLRQRGFNQAMEIARRLSRLTGIPLDHRSCVRQRKTEAQSNLTIRERRRNVRGAFKLVRPVGVRHVAIIDDVMTSGHTADELAGVLKKAGVERVEVWVMARTPKL